MRKGIQKSVLSFSIQERQAERMDRSRPRPMTTRRPSATTPTTMSLERTMLLAALPRLSQTPTTTTETTETPTTTTES